MKRLYDFLPMSDWRDFLKPLQVPNEMTIAGMAEFLQKTLLLTSLRIRMGQG